MKTLNILTTGAFATLLLLGSCTKDVDNPNSPGGGGEGGVVEGIPTYATVSLSQRTGAGTYAGAADYVNGTSQATEVEKKITDAVVLVFNSDDILENYVTLDVVTEGQAPNQTTVAKKTFATTTGKKRLYALANLGDYSDIADIFNGQNGKTAADKKLSNVCKVIQQIADISGATTDNKFWMSNVYKLGATIEDQVTVLNVNQTTVEGGNGDDATKNNFKVYIGRMTGKVTLSFSDALVVNSKDGTFDKDNAEYRVRNNPKRFYTFPVYEGTQLISPYYNRTYDLPTPIDYDDANTKVGKNDFFDNGHDNGGNHTFVPKATDSYLTENSPKEAKRHKVTFLSIKAKWTPNANAIILSADGSYAADQATALTKITSAAGAGGNDGTFYRVQKWENGLITGYCPGIYADIPTAWHEVGTAINTETKAGQLTDAAADRDEAKTKSKDELNANKAYLVVKYTNGIAYWAYWMRSRLDGTVAEKYALKRNNHYKVNIISVDGVGEPTEDDNLDKDEDLEADASMKATIEVLNWNVVDIEGGI